MTLGRAGSVEGCDYSRLLNFLMKSAVKEGQRLAYHIKRNQGEQKIFFRMRGEKHIY